MKTIIALLFVIVPILALGQLSKIDSLHIALNKTKTDTGKINRLNAIAEEYINLNPDSASYYANKSKMLAQKQAYKFGEFKAILTQGSIAYLIGKSDETLPILTKTLPELKQYAKNDTSLKTQKLLANFHNILGNNYFVMGNVDSALAKYNETLILHTKVKYKKGIATSLLNISNVQNLKGDVANALKNLLSSLKISEQINDKKVSALCYNNISKIYSEQKEKEKALEYSKKAYNLSVELNIISLASTCAYNVSTMLNERNEINEAFIYGRKSLEYAQQMKNDMNIAQSLVLMGNLYASKNDYRKSIEILSQALDLVKTSQNFSLQEMTYYSIANTYEMMGNNKQALFYGEKALAMANEQKNPIDISRNALLLTKVYKKSGDFKKALTMNELAVAMNDSVINKNNQKDIMAQEFKYAYEKQAIADSLKYDNDKKIQTIKTQANAKTQRNKQIALSIGLFIALISGAILYNRFKVTQKQKSLIERQSQRLEIAHNQLEEKSKEIQDSIIYSKEIQNAFLKSITDTQDYFQNSLLIYKPKATVSGDFYWYKEINNYLIVVVGDCTGHGVPGAIISVLAIQYLEKVIYDIKDFKSLHDLNGLMNKEFNTYYKKENHVGIGLDFSVIAINKKENAMYVSGSGGSIIVKTNSNELITQKFESINIGGSMPVIYTPTTSMYNLSHLASIYLYTDGIVDQKSEETGKKLGTKKLTELISNLNTNDANKALQIIETKLTEWQGNTIQIDDMTLLGIQFT